LRGDSIVVPQRERRMAIDDLGTIALARLNRQSGKPKTRYFPYESGILNLVISKW